MAGKTPWMAQHVPSGTISSFHIAANLQVYVAVSSKSECDPTARRSSAKQSCAGCLPKLTERGTAGETSSHGCCLPANSQQNVSAAE